MRVQDLQSYARLLNFLNTHDSITRGQQLHLLFLKKGVLPSTLSVANRLLQMYARCGGVDYVRRLFDEMTHRNVFSWNTLLEGYAKDRHKTGMLDVFNSMPEKNMFSWNTVISGLANVGELDVMRRLFHEMPWKNDIAWNKMIHGYARNGRPNMALGFFQDFLKWEALKTGGVLRLDPFVLATVVVACTELGGIGWGKQVHARTIVDYFEFDSVTRSSLVNMYAKCGDLDSADHLLNAMEDPDDYSLSSLIAGFSNRGRMNDARRIFELKFSPCAVLWNSLISGYNGNDDSMEALLLFKTMHKKGILGDLCTISSVISACGSVGSLKNGMQLHAHAHKLGTLYDLVVASSLVDAYGKCGSHSNSCKLFGELEIRDTVLLNSMITVYCNCDRIEEAKCIFIGIKSKSLISWNSMIVGLSQNSRPVEALDLFCKMNGTNLRMDNVTLSSVISACASIPSLELGEQVFARATIIGVNLDQVTATSLIDFYCKCGLVDSGRKIFDEIMKSDAVLWNSLLMGYATNGHGVEALNLFREMRREGVSPTEVTFTAVLSACDHCGLVEEGKNWFHRMKCEYHIDPDIEHYSCMVDLLARAGCLQEAINLINEMPFHSDSDMWSAILRGCIIMGDKSLSNKVAEKIIELDPQNSGALVQLSGLLASGGDWEKSALVRQVMKDMKIQKKSGRSWCNI